MPRIVSPGSRRAPGSQSRKLLRLCSLAAEIAKLGDQRSTLRRIVNAATSLVGVPSAHLALVDKKQRRVYGVASSGRRLPTSPAFQFRLSRSASARAALGFRTTIAIDRAAGDSRLSDEEREALSMGAAAYVPLSSRSETFGLLILVTRRPHVWTREELGLARHLANFASVALENSRLLRRLAEAESRFKSLVEHIPAIVYLCDFEAPYRSIYVSPRIETMLGYPSDEWMNDPGFWMKIIHPDDVTRPKGPKDAAIRTKGSFSAEFRVYDRSGDIRWIREEAVLVRDPAGVPIGWHGVLIEITGIKKMEQGPHESPPLGRRPRAPLSPA
jgi:PAS domain S-box-containing protein